MEKKSFRVGLIGYGRSGRDIHAWAAKRTNGRFSVEAISDITENRRIQAAAENTCPVYVDYREMAEKEDLDLFVVTSFSNQHIPISIDLLNRKKAVLCEKPLTNSNEEFEELAAVIKKTGAFFTSFHNLRYEPSFVKIREWINDGLIGEIMQIKMNAGQFSRRWDWQMSRALGGGTLMVSGVHILDLALCLAGEGYEPEVKSSLKHHGVGDADNYAKVLLTSGDGPIIDIECSYFDAFPGPRYHIQGALGTIIGADNKVEVKFYDPNAAPPISLETAPIQNAEGNPAFCKEELPVQTQSWSHRSNLYHASFLAYYDHLYRALTGHAEAPVSLDELRKQVRVLDACYKDAKL